MRPTNAVALAAAIVLTATAASAEWRHDVQVPRGEEIQAPRGDEIQAPRGQEIQAPRGEEIQMPRQ
jgi:hypothetical protein